MKPTLTKIEHQISNICYRKPKPKANSCQNGSEWYCGEVYAVGQVLCHAGEGKSWRKEWQGLEGARIDFDKKEDKKAASAQTGEKQAIAGNDGQPCSFLT